MKPDFANLEKCEQIKTYLEDLTGLHDIGLTRKREVVDVRKLYCYLCRKYTDASLDLIGSVLREGFKHDSVLDNIKKFNNLNDTKQLHCQDIVIPAEAGLLELKTEYKEIKENLKKFKPKNSREQEQIERLMNIILKGHSIILRKTSTIHQLKQQNTELEKTIHNNLEDILLDS